MPEREIFDDGEIGPGMMRRRSEPRISPLRFLQGHGVGRHRIGWKVAVGLLSGAYLAGLALPATTAQAQGEVASLLITHVDTSTFPAMTLYAVARDAGGQPVVLASMANLSLKEDGVERPLESIQPAEVGLRVAFVIDWGDGLVNTGVSLATVFQRARDYIQAFSTGQPWMKAGLDEATVIVQEGPSSFLIVPMTSDPAAVDVGLSAYRAPRDSDLPRPATYGANTAAALQQALDELEFTPGGEGKYKVVVLFTPGMRGDLDEVAARAAAAGIPLHVVLVRDQASRIWGEALRPLAEATLGGFWALYEARDLTPLFDQIAGWREQTALAYHSTSTSTAPRHVLLALSSGDKVFEAEGSYTASPLPPQLTIVAPAAGEAIVRGDPDIPTASAAADPQYVLVTAEVFWPDGFPRQVQAQLVVDGVAVGEADIVEGKLVGTWDVRDFRSRKPVSSVLEFDVTDELGYHVVSRPITVTVEYGGRGGWVIPDTAGLAVVIVLVLAAVAVAAVVLVRRSSVLPGLRQARQDVVDFVDRVTGRRTSHVARAFLVPVEGMDRSALKAYEIYGTTAIGRSRRHADLLFHINDEDSPISRLHCTVLDEDDHFALRDEDSANGTYVNGEKLEPLIPRALQDGDLIDVALVERGGIRFVFQLPRPDGSAPDLDDELRLTRPHRPTGPETLIGRPGD